MIKSLEDYSGQIGLETQSSPFVTGPVCVAGTAAAPIGKRDKPRQTAPSCAQSGNLGLCSTNIVAYIRTCVG